MKIVKDLTLSVGEMLTTDQTAAVLGCHYMTLSKQRQEGRGIPYLKVGRKVYYLKTDIEAYLLASRVGNQVAN